MRYQVLARRRGKGELRKFTMDVVDFAPPQPPIIDIRGSYGVEVWWEGFVACLTDSGLYVAGNIGNTYRDKLSLYSTPTQPVGISITGSPYSGIAYYVDGSGCLFVTNGHPASCDDYGVEKIYTPPGLYCSSVHVGDVAHHITVLDPAGDVYVYGINTFGELGLGHSNHVGIFTKVEGLPEPMKNVVQHDYAQYIIGQSGVVYGSGSNNYPNKGFPGGDRNTFGQIVSLTVPVTMGRGSTNATVFVGENGLVYALSSSGSGFAAIPGLSNVKKAWIGGSATSTVFMRNDNSIGTISIWGSNLVEAGVSNGIAGGGYGGVTWVDVDGKIWSTKYYDGTTQPQPLEFALGYDSCVYND